jgi:hypothetical protein
MCQQFLGQKHKGTLAFNYRIIAQNVFTSCSSKLSNHVYSTGINRQHKNTKQTNKRTNNNTPIKRKALKEHTKV